MVAGARREMKSETRSPKSNVHRGRAGDAERRVEDAVAGWFHGLRDGDSGRYNQMLITSTGFCIPRRRTIISTCQRPLVPTS